MFELHLLESGISGVSLFNPTKSRELFELHLLESGISGIRNLDVIRVYDGVVWTPLTGIWYFGAKLFQNSRNCYPFELHLLESGISGNESVSLKDLWAWFETHLLESGISGKRLLKFL